MTDNADIRRMFEQVARQNHELRRRIEKLENAPADLRNAAIDGGKGLLVKSGDETVRLGDNGIEHQGGPTPFPPAPPFVDAGGETVKIQHSGLDVYENIAPRDFLRTQVHVSQDETFDPSLSTLAGFIDAPNGGMTHRLPGGEWHIGVVWETRSGKLSDLSETVLADIAPLVDADEIQNVIDDAKNELEEAIQEYGNREGTTPPQDPAPDGVIYYQRESDDGPVVAVWQYRDDQWHGLPLTDAVLTAVTTDKLVAGESLIDGVLIKDGAVTAEKITVTEELTAAIAQFLKVKADMLEANAIDGMNITGSTLQTRPETEQGIKLRAAQNDLVAYDQDGKQRVHIDGTTGSLQARDGEIVGGYIGTDDTGERVYMQGTTLTARDANNDITAQLGPGGLALRDAGGTLQNIGNHIYGAEQFTAATGMNRGAVVNSASSANTWGSWVYGYLSKSSVITSNRYRVDVTFIIDGYARAAGTQTAVRFMVQPTDMNENLVDPRMNFFDRSIYTGDPLFAVPRSFTLTGTVTLNRAWPVGTPYRVRYAARTQNFDGTVRISNISIMMQPI